MRNYKREFYYVVERAPDYGGTPPPEGVWVYHESYSLLADAVKEVERLFSDSETQEQYRIAMHSMVFQREMVARF